MHSLFMVKASPAYVKANCMSCFRVYVHSFVYASSLTIYISVCLSVILLSFKSKYMKPLCNSFKSKLFSSSARACRFSSASMETEFQFRSNRHEIQTFRENSEKMKINKLFLIEIKALRIRYSIPSLIVIVSVPNVPQL